jgi:hypothetical protein
MPVSRFLPYTWYDTPNIHFCTVRDFETLCRQRGIRILGRDMIGSGDPLARRWPNLFAPQRSITSADDPYAFTCRFPCAPGPRCSRPAGAQQSERFGPYELHYSVLNSTFISAGGSGTVRHHPRRNRRG